MWAKFNVRICRTVSANFSHKWIFKLLVCSPTDLLLVLLDSKGWARLKHLKECVHYKAFQNIQVQDILHMSLP
jgi:hypothetical protein